MRQHVFPKWGDRPINALTRSDVVDIHAALTRAGSPTRANRVVATLSSLFGWLQRDRGYTGVNPAAGVEKNPEHGREVFLTAAQVRDALAGIERYAQRGNGRWAGRSVADCLTFIIATGCRSHEAKAARWSEFDDDLGTWIKAAPTTKQRRVHRVPLNDIATDVLRRRRDARHIRPVCVPWPTWRSSRQAAPRRLESHPQRRQSSGWRQNSRPKAQLCQPGPSRGRIAPADRQAARAQQCPNDSKVQSPARFRSKGGRRQSECADRG